MSEVTREELLAEIELLKAKNKELEVDIAEIINTIKAMLTTLGVMNEDGKIPEEYLSGEESFIMPILNTVKSAIFNPKKLEDKFSFIQSAIPTVLKYAGRN